MGKIGRAVGTAKRLVKKAKTARTTTKRIGGTKYRVASARKQNVGKDKLISAMRNPKRSEAFVERRAKKINKALTPKKSKRALANRKKTTSVKK